MRIDQLVPAFHRGDAIGDEARFSCGISSAARGFDSEIYCLNRDRGLEGESGSSPSSRRPAPEMSPSSISPCRRP